MTISILGSPVEPSDPVGPLADAEDDVARAEGTDGREGLAGADARRSAVVDWSGALACGW